MVIFLNPLRWLRKTCGVCMVQQDIESIFCVLECKMVQLLWKRIWRNPQKKKFTILFQHLHPKEMKAVLKRCLPTYINYSIIPDSQENSDKILHTTRWMNLKD